MAPLVARLGRMAVVAAACAAVLMTTRAQAALNWPLDERTMGESADLIHHLTAVARGLRPAGEPLREPELLASFYMRRDYRPGWFDRDGVFVESEDLLRALRQAGLDGLSPGGFHLQAIERQLAEALDSALQLAHLDLLLTDAYFHYARRLRYGSVPSLWEMHLPAAPRTTLVEGLESALSHRRLAPVLDELAPPYAGYRRLRLMLARYRAVQRRGGWPVIPDGPVLKRGSRGVRVQRLRWRLAAGGDLADVDMENAAYFDKDVEKALRRFQHRHGLDPDGVAGAHTLAVLNIPVEQRLRQLRLNMERWRWLPPDLGERYILVNSAAYQLAIYENGSRVRSMRVIVGRQGRQTPGIVSRIDRLVINPYWYVPASALKELLPRIGRDRSLLSRRSLKVFSDLSGRGREVDPARVQWSSYGTGSARFPYVLRQEPGPGNALGRVKFLLPNEQDIYLHDTPAQHLFKREQRALSHGCIRLDEPLALARYLLAGNGWSAERFQLTLDSGKPEPVSLDEPVPIVLGYWTAWVEDSGELHFRQDHYRRDGRIASALGQ